MNLARSFHLIPLFVILSTYLLDAQGVLGYYQYPDIHGDQIVFCAEGDVWKVSTQGGLATRITTHLEEERYPAFSPDGKTILYSASYEGPQEIYTLPVDGGHVKRWSYEGDPSIANTWTPDGKIVYATRAYNKKPDLRLVSIDPDHYTKSFIPLDQASEAAYDDGGKTIYFVSPAYHRNVTKRYVGGTARQIWKYTLGSQEAVKLTTDYNGESHHPKWYAGRVYFLTDRDGMMNIWSMKEDGSDLKQHTHHQDFDVRYHNLDQGRIVYHHGADLYLYDIANDRSEKLQIKLVSDLHQLQEKWEDNPYQYITSVHPDSTGSKVVVTARGRLLVHPVDGGRSISYDDHDGIRYRDAVFSHDGDKVIALSDASGEFEFVEFEADGLGKVKALSNDAEVLRHRPVPSYDGKYIAYDDLDKNLYILNKSTGRSTKISDHQEGIYDFSWSPDSKWLAYVEVAHNTMAQIWIYNILTKDKFPLTTDRANSMNPRWSPDGKFIYFLSDRNFHTLVGSPWGTRQPEPYFDISEKIYHVALRKGERSPFRPADELYDAKEKKDEKSVIVKIDKDGIQKRIETVPVDPGNYANLSVNDEAIYVLSSSAGADRKTALSCVKMSNKDPEITEILADVVNYEMTVDGKKLLIRKGRNYHMVNAATSSISDLSDGKIDIGSWKFKINPREDWQQLYTDAWRMERDYFYDKNMHGVNWDAMYKKYLPLVDRVTTRQELSDVIGRFVGELSALHTSVRGGDVRSDDDYISVASLGAIITRDEGKDALKINYIYEADPDYPDEKSPLDDPYLDVKVGDHITKVNGQSTSGAIDMGALLRNQAGRQVRLTVERDNIPRDIIVEPIRNAFNLRYRDWEYNNRLYVEDHSAEDIGYLHLRAMGTSDINQFYREFYPVFNRKGLIIDVRYNWGGNIDSFILEKLLRKAWMYWKGRSGEPYWNMPYAFRGHIVILVNENTYSDGEAFADGFKKLELGTAIGKRTWGGEIWLHSGNRLSDNGLARAPMFGVYAGNEWLIEGHGFEPDIEVDNMPHATFNGEDAQLDAAIDFLKKKIAEEPITVPPPPAYPDKSFDNNK